MQVVLIYLLPLRCNSVLKCASQSEIVKKFTKTLKTLFTLFCLVYLFKTPYFGGSRSFQVINLDIP